MVITDEILNSHIDKLKSIIYGINYNKVTILVGKNGTGKSLIRKQLGLRLQKEFGDSHSHLRQVSMQLRTETYSSLGALSTIAHDDPADPTSLCSYNLLTTTMNYDMESKKDYYIVLDELEVGMSTETILGVVQELKTLIPKWLENCLGILVITHSEVFAEELYNIFDCDFINLGYNEVDYDFEKWLNRELIPTDMKFLEEWSTALYHEINKHTKSRD